MSHPLRVIAERLGAELIGNPEEPISGVNALELARSGELTFAEGRYAKGIERTRAAAVIVSLAVGPVAGKNLLRVAQPREAFVKAMGIFYQPPRPTGGVHPSAVVASSATVAPDAAVKECAVIRDRATIGGGTIIESGVHVGAGVTVGEQCWIGPNVALMEGVTVGNRVIVHSGSVVGGDGFGYVWMGDHHQKIPQLGTVVIEDDVELGCNVCVDRATFGTTIVRRGAKVDNLVQIAHNNAIGEHVILCGQVGLAGSVTVGKGSVLGGQVGVVDHVRIGDGVKAGGGTIIIRDVKPGETIWGYPHRPIKQTIEEGVYLSRLPKLVAQLKRLSEQVEALEARLQSRDGPPSEARAPGV